MPNRSKEGARAGEPVKIKKYANRRLYNTETSTYVTLDDLAQMVREKRDFVVLDAKTGEDLTHSVLTQIILEQESKGQSLLPVNFLRQLICFYGDSMEKLVPSYLEMSLSTLAQEQERYRKQIKEAFAGTPMELPMEALQKQAEQNLAMFEQALSMFAPFGLGGAAWRKGAQAGMGEGAAGARARAATEEAADSEQGTEAQAARKTTSKAGSAADGARDAAARSGDSGRDSGRSGDSGENGDAIRALQEQLTAIQQQLAALAGSGTKSGK